MSRITEKEIREQFLIPKEILGATEKNGVLEFLIEWTSDFEPKLVKSSEAKELCPQLIIEFYEKRLVWRQEFSEQMNEAVDQISQSEITDDDTTDDEINLK